MCSLRPPALATRVGIDGGGHTLAGTTKAHCPTPRTLQRDGAFALPGTPARRCDVGDPKNLYKRARAGEIGGLTGVDAPYAVPVEPDLDTER